MKKQEFKKWGEEEGLRNLWDNFKRSNIWIIEVPEGKDEEQEIENLFEKNNEGKLPHSGKGNRHAQVEVLWK